MALYNPTSDGAIAPCHVEGRHLSRQVKRLGIEKRALLAHELVRGALYLQNLTRSQAGAVAGVSVSYLNTVHRASPAELELLSRGWLKLSKLHNKQRYPVTDDDDVERIISKIGFKRVWNVMDRMTAPASVVAAE